MRMRAPPSLLAEDVWSIIVCIENGEKLPRSILKNGKRSKADLNKSRMLASQSATNNCEPTLNSQSTLSYSSQNQTESVLNPISSQIHIQQTKPLPTTHSSLQPNQDTSVSSQPILYPTSSQGNLNSSVSAHFMGRELNLLRKEVISLRSEVRVLEKAFTSLQGDQDLVLVKRELAHLSTEVEKIRSLSDHTVQSFLDVDII